MTSSATPATPTPPGRRPFAALFPVDEGLPLPPSRAALLAGALVVGAGVSLLRQTGAGAFDTLWGRDGTDLLPRSLDHPVLGSLGVTSDGWLRVVPRLVAALAGAFPTGRTAELYAVFSALVLARIAVFVFNAAQAHVRPALPRFLLATSVVVLPVASTDVVNDVVANLRFPFLVAAFWALLWNPRRPAEQFFAGAVVTLAVLSDPAAALLAPVAVARALAVPGRRGVVAPALLAVGTAVQVAVHLAGAGGGGAGAQDLLGRFGFDVLAVGTFGSRLPGGAGGTARAAAFEAAAVLLVALAGWYGRRTRSALGALAAAEGVLLYLGSVLIAGDTAPRYAVAPALLLLSAADAVVAGRPGPTAVLAAVVALAVLTGFRTGNPRSDGPRFGPELAATRAACRAGTPPPTTAVLRTSPPGTTTHLRCADL